MCKNKHEHDYRLTIKCAYVPAYAHSCKDTHTHSHIHALQVKRWEKEEQLKEQGPGQETTTTFPLKLWMS